jgi:hypothetical protein
MDGAAALTKRYNEKLGLIRSWGAIDEKKNFLVIVDNMMNLELLEWAAKNGGDAKFAAIAKSHDGKKKRPEELEREANEEAAEAAAAHQLAGSEAGEDANDD